LAAAHGRHVQVLASTVPFAAWPMPALARLVGAASLSAHARGDLIHAGGSEIAAATLVVDGVVQASVAAAGGRRVIFEICRGASVHGLLPLLDGRAMPNDLIAIEPTTTLAIPFAAIRDELALAPTLWQTLCEGAAQRARCYAEQMMQFLFDAPRVRMAAVLLSLAQGEAEATDGPVVVGMRLPQGRLAEMIGLSRQWATSLVRELSEAGLIEWRYGRVTLLDPAALRGIALESINASIHATRATEAPPPV
jgi:CRP/FNR family transcriptional regulator, cyclic AMP receptor protein